MAYILAVVLIAISTGLIVMQILYVLVFLHRLNRKSTRSPSADRDQNTNLALNSNEEIAVILCLRGTDPSLMSCLRGLANQSEPNFQLQIVVDSEDDPALTTVHQSAAHFKQLKVQTITKRYSTCSLKCSAILTAINSLSETVSIIAFLDADTVPDRDWLRDLVRPLGEFQAGASTGMRWFECDSPSLGTAVRQLWNTAAIVQMGLYNIAWGGSFAIRRDTLSSTALLDRWQTAFCEDTLLTSELRRAGLKLEQVADLIAVNRETTTLRDAFGWITRQLITLRLHNPFWPLVQAHALATFGCNLAPWVGLILILLGHAVLGGILLGIWLLQQASNGWLLILIERKIDSLLQARLNRNSAPSAANPSSQRSLVTRVAATLLTQWLYPVNCLIASLTRNIRWRGIRYAISGGSIERLDYTPYSSVSTKDESGQTDRASIT